LSHYCVFFIGIFKHSQSISKTYLADASPSVNHAKVFGNFNAISNLGFVIGPLIGGHLAMQTNGFSKVATLTGVIFIINFFFVWLFVKPVEALKGTHSSRQEVVGQLLDGGSTEVVNNKVTEHLIKRESDHEESGNAANTEAESTPKATGIRRIASLGTILDLLVLRFLMGFSMLVFRSNFMSMLEFHFNTNPKTNGYIMSYNGLVSGLSGLFIGSLADFYNHNDYKMQLHFSCLLTASILGITFSPNIYFVAAFITPLAVSSAVGRVCLTNLTFQRSREDEKGVVLGVGNSLLSFARMISPALGGVLQEFSPYAPGSMGAMLAALGILLMILFPPNRNMTNKGVKKID